MIILPERPTGSSFSARGVTTLPSLSDALKSVNPFLTEKGSKLSCDGGGQEDISSHKINGGSESAGEHIPRFSADGVNRVEARAKVSV